MVISPLTNSTNTELQIQIDSEKILERYSLDLQINVERFFLDRKTIDVYKCKDTGYLFYYPFDIIGDEKLYDDLKIKMHEIYHTPYYPDWKWEYDIALKYIQNSKSVLEVGCGSGLFLNKLKSINESRILKGLDLNHFSVNEVKSKGIDAEVKTIQDYSKTNELKYDVVSCFQVLEHVADVHSFLQASIDCLKTNGKLIIAVPYNNPFLFNQDIYHTLNLPPHHMGLWTREAFENLSKFFPLKRQDITIESLPGEGHDFDRFYSINKDVLYKPSFPLKGFFDKLYYRYLKKYHHKYAGKNIIAIYSKT